MGIATSNSTKRDLLKNVSMRLTGGTDPHMRSIVNRLPAPRQAEQAALGEDGGRRPDAADCALDPSIAR